MATLRTIRLRIKGTKNIKQITRAMEAVSAVKMRKSQQAALAARPYATAALRLLKNIHGSSVEGGVLSPLLEKREVKNTLLVVVTSDKGLAGPFNANVLKKAEQFIKNTAVEPKKVISIAAVGKKAGEYFSRRGRTPANSWTGHGDFVELGEVEHVFDFVRKSFEQKKVDEVFVVYTNFLSAMKQEVVVRKLLPFSEEGLEEMVKGIAPDKGRFAEVNVQDVVDVVNVGEYLFEPSPKEIFDTLLPTLLKIEIYHAILEANASEHSSRMIAMRNATDNAGELIKSYTVSLNKARQSAINKELAEITGGSEALTQ
ncbi:MAG: ATP synthase F1 subunit gamma [Candidatus Taylorbacteria bacterium RIFCSPHIGHO2_01_FULL_51_15]|uniref:ATP synthase gamma chain n=1 Tax=Candidatus Taylorbacteria bacterium RIFCSPHIGHO2_01_FULL_51_15 TaxID=1802304 RepID=A0A1G2MC36_9BACT|nr:MAG: ATP synthase F1 subunit gamma [Candidatus Taylorbacteria bacterium RIFCSPHIGHO2_01_FULL_51_15]